MPQKNSLKLSGLYAITDCASCSPNQVIINAELALKGGAQILQYRDKTNDKKSQQKIAKELLQVCTKYHKPLIINDDIALAKSIGAHGVHLGQKDGSIAKARDLLGPEAIIGATCHNSLSLAERAIKESASYIAFGRFFNSKTKPNVPTAPVSLLKQARAEFDAPIVAIGGITKDNAALLIQQGADAIAVVHELFSSQNIQQTASELQSLFETTSETTP